MNELAPADPFAVLRDLDARHDDVLRQLEDLNRQIERALADDRLRSASAKPQLNLSAGSAAKFAPQLACGFASTS